MQIDEAYNDPSLQAYSENYQQQNYGQQVFRNGMLVPLGAAFIQETTIFREFGPLAGNTMRLAYDVSPKIGGVLSRQTFDADARHYLRIGTTGLLATRIRGFKSIGDFPDFTYFGGNSELRGYDYLQFVGTERACSPTRNCASRIIEAALTPIGVIGGIRGVFFANIGGGWFDGQLSGTAANGCGDPTATFKFFANNTMVCTPVIGNVTDAAGLHRARSARTRACR